jgi:hypothetical protein
MSRTLLLVSALLPFAAAQIQGASPYILDFEDIPSDNSTTIRQITYVNGGYEFSAPGGGLIYRDSALIQPNPAPGYFEPPVNGTKYLASFTGSQPLLRRADGGTFSLFGLDLAEYSSAFAEPQAVTVTGTFLAGGTISTVLNLDGHVDALPDPPDFQSFVFSPEWNGLVEVRFLTSDSVYSFVRMGTSFDNLLLSPVPEPSAIAITLSGLGMFWWRQLSRRR